MLQPLSSVGPQECTATFCLLPGGGWSCGAPGSISRVALCLVSYGSWPAPGLDAQQVRSSSALQNPSWSCPFGLLSFHLSSVSALCPEQKWMHPRTHMPCVILNKRARTPTKNVWHMRPCPSLGVGGHLRKALKPRKYALSIVNYS